MKKGLILMLIIAIILIVGCTGKKPTTTTGPFIGGTDGLSVKFAQGEPPTAVLDNKQEDFFITLLVKNNGEFTVPVNGLVSTLSGISQQAFNIQSMNKKNSFEIFGAKKEVDTATGGAEESIEFGEANYQINIPADFSTTIRGDICYAYQTKAVANLCLKKNVLKKDIDDVCDVNIPNLNAANSGSPIQFTNARQTSVGTNKIKVTFKIMNSGDGAVYEPNAFSDTCGGKEENKDKVKLTLTSPGGKFSVKCTQLGNSDSGTIKLVNKEKEISCTIDTTSLQEITFQDVLLFQADFMYREGVVTPLLIRNAEG